jgi:hypothetical protein
MTPNTTGCHSVILNHIHTNIISTLFTTQVQCTTYSEDSKSYKYSEGLILGKLSSHHHTQETFRPTDCGCLSTALARDNLAASSKE